MIAALLAFLCHFLPGQGPGACTAVGNQVAHQTKVHAYVSRQEAIVTRDARAIAIGVLGNDMASYATAAAVAFERRLQLPHAGPFSADLEISARDQGVAACLRWSF